MKKLLLTESQAKLLMEEIDKNDSIQKLLFNDSGDISLIIENNNDKEIKIIIKVGKKEIDEKIVSIKLTKISLHNEDNNKDYDVFDLKMFINDSICNFGIENKILSKIIEQGYSPISLKLSNTNCCIEDIICNFDTIPMTNNNQDILGYIIK